MEDKKHALLLWLQAVTDSEIADINDLKDGKLIEELLSKIEGFSFSSSSDEHQSWKTHYNKLKDIYEQLNSFLQKNSKMALPEELTVMNIIEMAQGKTQEGLETLLHLVFIVCIQSSIRSEVIPCIMKFPSSAQNELMMIIKESTIDREDEDERQTLIHDYKQTITKLEYAYNTVAQENEALRTSLMEDQERMRKNQDLLLKLTKENQSLNRQLFQKNQMLIRHREELMLDKYGSVNEDLVEELKKELLERQQSSGDQIMRLKETVNSLNDELAHLKKSNLELMEDKASRSVVEGRAADHTNCIAIQKHKAKINEMLILSKQATQKEMAVKLQNIKLKNQNAQLQNKIKVLNEQVHKKNQDFLVTKQDGNKLKVEFFSRIRDSLKQRLEEFNLKNKESGTNFFEDQS